MLSLLLATLLTQATMTPSSDLSTNRVRATGTVTARAFRDRFAETFNVRDFGAVGDGVANDTTAIGLAVTAALAAPRKRVVYFPPGAYLVTGKISVTDAYVKLVGSGGQTTSLLCRPSTPSTDCVEFTYPTPYASHNAIQGMTLDGTGSTNLRYGISLYNQEAFHGDDVYTVGGVAGLRFNLCDISEFRRSYFRGASTAGVYSDDGPSTTTSFKFFSCDLSNNTGNGYRGGNAKVTFIGNVFQANSLHAVSVGKGSDWNGTVNLAYNHFEDNALGEIYAGDTYNDSLNTNINSTGNEYIGRKGAGAPPFSVDLGSAVFYSDEDFFSLDNVTTLVRANRQTPVARITRRVFFKTDPRPENFTNPVAQDDSPGGWTGVIEGAFGNQRRFGVYGTAAPVTGTWRGGDVAWNTSATSGGPAGWVYSNTDSSWHSIGYVDALTAGPDQTNLATTTIDPAVNVTIAPNATYGSWLATVNSDTSFTLSNPTGSHAAGELLFVTVRNHTGGVMTGTLTFGSQYQHAAWTHPANATAKTIGFIYVSSLVKWVEIFRSSDVDFP